MKSALPSPRPSGSSIDRPDLLQRLWPFVLNLVLCGFLDNVATIFLYVRLAPYGAPYVLDWSHYLFHQLFYGWYGVALLSLPFFLTTALWRRMARSPFRWLLTLQGVVLFGSLVIRHLDHEVTRHMGVRMSLELFGLYGDVSRVPDTIWPLFAEDAGGAWSSIWLLAIPLLFGVFSLWLHRRRRTTVLLRRLSPVQRTALLVVSMVLLYLLPAFFRSSVFGGKNRQTKVKPPALLVLHNLRDAFAPQRQYHNIEERIATFQARWQEVDGGRWAFVSPDHPVWKTRSSSCPVTNQRWNVILIVLETFRAMNMAPFNPDQKLNATPFLNSLTQASHSAYWTRCISNGQPTVFSFMSLHTSLLPHSGRTVARTFPLVGMSSLPGILRNNGYQTAFFTGSDPDWDNQRVWLNRWYDTVYYNPADQERDRAVFRKAAVYLKHDVSPQNPFLLTIFSITNHTPFRSPEPKFNIYDGTTLSGRIHNTMRYTDDVVREFLESLEKEPWFDNTLVVITGDHGLDLGERGVSGGHAHIRHETNWVPLILSATHPRLPHGRHTDPASHIDIAPTILDLLGICDDNAFVGHSLLGRNVESVLQMNLKSGNMGMETATHSFFFPLNQPESVYGAADLLQMNDLAETATVDAGAVRQTGALYSEVTDYLYERNRIVPNP